MDPITICHYLWLFSLLLISYVNKCQEEEMGIDTFNLDTGTLNNLRYWRWHPVLVWYLPQLQWCAQESFPIIWSWRGFGHGMTSSWSGQELFKAVTRTIVTSPICIRHSRTLLKKSLWSSHLRLPQLNIKHPLLCFLCQCLNLKAFKKGSI